MKTKNVFVLDGTKVTARILDVSNPDVEVKDAPVLEERTYDAALCPEMLAKGDGVVTFAAYGLSKLLQDRNAAFTDLKAKEEGATTAGAIAEARLNLYSDLFDNTFMKGLFQAERKGGGGGASGVDGAFIQAFQEYVEEKKGTVLDNLQAEALLKNIKKDAEQWKAVKDAIGTRAREIRAEAAAAVADLDLGELF